MQYEKIELIKSEDKWYRTMDGMNVKSTKKYVVNAINSSGQLFTTEMMGNYLKRILKDGGMTLISWHEKP